MPLFVGETPKGEKGTNQVAMLEVIAHLTDGRTSLLVVSDGGMPIVAHFGTALGEAPIDVTAIERPAVGGGLDIDPPVGLVAESAAGWFGRPGIEGHRLGGRDFAPRFTLVDSSGAGAAVICQLRDKFARLDLDLHVELHPSGVATFRATLLNAGSDDYHLAALRLSLPISISAGELLTVGGRHLFEFGQHRTPWQNNCITIENRHGKTSHERLGVVFAGTPGFSEHSGEVWGCHVGWSGNYELVCDSISDARRCVHAGELLVSGEVVLKPGDRYETPVVFAAYSSTGLNPVSCAFHDYLRARPNHPRLPRPIHLNTWEAVYFDHDVDRLKQLADVAAVCGIERFVLDDGWFHSRRDDRAGLGDWWIDPDVWPDGLGPIVDHVRGLGMEFGLWFEPEMVNPDSDLYRSHSDWALVDDRYPHVLGRNQLVLDLGRPEVGDYLFGQIDALLDTYEIAYIKWDHNRDLVSPASGAAAGAAGVHRQTLGVYDLIDRLRAAHPGVEIETCGSGGGRVDFGILDRTDRVWTSDSIDALDRHRIQQGFSLVFPPELMGSHIGAPVTHATGRQHRIDFRGIAALFGSFGVEWNLLAASPDERQQLAALVALHKRLRPLLHTGDVFRADHADPTVEIHGVIARDRGEAVIAVTRLSSGPSHHTAPIRVLGLQPDVMYEVRHIPVGYEPLGSARQQPTWFNGKLMMTGRQLAALGFSVPEMRPENSLLFHIEASGPIG